MRKLSNTINRWRRSVLWVSPCVRAVQYLDRHCQSVKITNEDGLFQGYWHNDNGIIVTVQEIKERLGSGVKTETKTQ